MNFCIMACGLIAVLGGGGRALGITARGGRAAPVIKYGRPVHHGMWQTGYYGRRWSAGHHGPGTSKQDSVGQRSRASRGGGARGRGAPSSGGARCGAAPDGGCERSAKASLKWPSSRPKGAAVASWIYSNWLARFNNFMCCLLVELENLEHLLCTKNRRLNTSIVNLPLLT